MVTNARVEHSIRAILIVSKAKPTVENTQNKH